MQIDDAFMNEVGLGDMSEDEKRVFMQHAEEELEVRVGQGISMFLTDEQIAEFEGITDIDQAQAWLEHYLPSYREICDQIFADFKQELIAERQKILS